MEQHHHTGMTYGLRSNSMLSPSHSLNTGKQTSDGRNPCQTIGDRSYKFASSPDTKNKKMLLTITKEDSNKI